MTCEKYGVIGYTAYVAAHKDKLFKSQLEIYSRGVNNTESAETEKYFVDVHNNPVKDFREKNANGKFYPEYYVIPANAAMQRDLADAYDMQAYLLRNGVKVDRLTQDVTVGDKTYKKGDFVVDLHQAKRSMANVVLYKGKKVEGWTGLYSESVTNFPEMRGFTCDAITEAGVFKGKTEETTSPVTPASETTGEGTAYVIIGNDSLDSVNAVNDLLSEGVSVGMITKAGKDFAKGDFVIYQKDASKIPEKYALALTKTDEYPQAKVIKQPKLYVNENSTFDYFAFTKQMNFKTVSKPSQANVIFSSDEPDKAVTAAVKAGKAFVGASSYVMDFAKKSIKGLDYKAETEKDYWGNVEFIDYEALARVDYGSSLITASYEAAGDDTIYTKGSARITKVPKGAEVLYKVKSKDYFKAGWWSNVDQIAGKAMAVDYHQNGLNMTIFANSITNKAHQTDDYRLAVNAIYKDLLGDSFTKEPAVVSGGMKYDISGGSAVLMKGVNKAKVTVPSSIKVNGKTYKVTSIAASAFKGDKKLKSIVIGSNIRAIGSKALYGDKKLAKITFKGKKVKRIGSSAFRGIYKKAVFKAPSSKLKSYKKMIKKAGAPKKAKYKKL